MPENSNNEIKNFLEGKYSPKGQEMWNKWYDRTDEVSDVMETIQSDRSKLKKELKQIKKTKKCKLYCKLFVLRTFEKKWQVCNGNSKLLPQ